MPKEKENLKLIFYIGTHRLSGILADTLSPERGILRFAEIDHPEGFQRGEVAQLERALVSVGELIKKLELGDDALEIPAYVLVSNPHLKMTRFSSSIHYASYPRVITSREVQQVIAQTRNVAPLPLEEWILQVIPESFWVNDLTGVQDPIGLEAQRLAVSLQIFSMKYASFRNLSKVFETLEFNVKGYFPKSLVLAEGVLHSGEKEGEVLVIDFSDAATHLVLTREGKLAGTRSLDLGSQFFTTRISEKWQIGARDAERLKEQFGSLEENLKFGGELIPLAERNGHAHHQIKKAEFHETFFKLGEELLSRLEKEVRSFLEEARTAHPTLILTGGGIRLEGFLEFLSRRLSFPVRVGTPRHLEGGGPLLMNPAWTGPLGLVRWLSNTSLIQNRFSAKETIPERLLLQFKEWLVAYF